MSRVFDAVVDAMLYAEDPWHTHGRLSSRELLDGYAPGPRAGTMLLRSSNLPEGRRTTVVASKPLLVHFTLREGWADCDGVLMWPDQYLRSIKTGRLGGSGPRFAAMWLHESKWVYDTILKRLYYYPWRVRSSSA